MKFLSAEEIRELGILQEANRTLFHPLGLALQVDLDTGSMLAQDYRDDPEGIRYADGVMSAEKHLAFEGLRRRSVQEPAV